MFGKKEEKRVAAKPDRAESRKPAQDDQPKKLCNQELAAVAGGYPRPYGEYVYTPKHEQV